MAVPAGDFGDLLVTDRAESPLFFPEVPQPSFSFERADHLHIKPFLEVAFPGRIVGIGLCTNFRVPFDTNRVGREQTHPLDLTILTLEDPSKHPPIRASGRPVFLLDPPARFVAVPSLCPGPEGVWQGLLPWTAIWTANVT